MTCGPHLVDGRCGTMVGRQHGRGPNEKINLKRQPYFLWPSRCTLTPHDRTGLENEIIATAQFMLKKRKLKCRQQTNWTYNATGMKAINHTNQTDAEVYWYRWGVCVGLKNHAVKNRREQPKRGYMWTTGTLKWRTETENWTPETVEWIILKLEVLQQDNWRHMDPAVREEI